MIDSSSVTNSTTNATTNNTTIQSTTIQSTTITTAITANTCSTNQFGMGINASGYLSCQYPAENFLTGLIGYWPLNYNLTDTTTPDMSGYGNTGTLVNSPEFVSGLFGNALNFSSASSQYVYTPSFALTTTSKILTFSFIINFNAISGNARIFETGNELATSDIEIIYSTGSSEWQYVYDTGSTDLICNFPNTINTNVYYFITIVANYHSQTISLYNDGSLVTSCSMSSGALPLMRNVIYIASYSGSSNFFNGKLQELRIYSWALSSIQIQEQYNYYENIANGV